MARKQIKRKGKAQPQKTVRCMNSDPDSSKWGAWAPVGGCRRRITVDADVTAALCWECTSKTTSNPINWHQDAMPD